MTEDENIEDVLFLIKNIEEHTTQNDNDCLKLHGYSPSENDSFTLWVFKDDWMDDIERREDEYLDTLFETAIRDKSGGTRNHVWLEYLYPAEKEDKENWFDNYLKSRDIELDRPTEKEVEQKLKEVTEFMGEKTRGGHQPEEKLSDEPPEGESAVDRDSPDRNTRIERQAAMHFASRVLSAKTTNPTGSSILEDRAVENDSENGRATEQALDEEIEKELNKWMRKFQRGVTTGKIQ